MKILILGSGPDRVGKMGELNHMADRAVRLLTQKGNQVIYLDSNPNTMASAYREGVTVYMEPLTLSCIENIIEKERPDGIIYCFGGLEATNLIVFLDREGILDKLGVHILGTPTSSLRAVFEEEIFNRTMAGLGIDTAEFRIARSIDTAVQASHSIGFPLIMRAAFASEGGGGYLAYNIDEVKTFAPLAFNTSPVREIILNKIKYRYVQVAIECFRDLNRLGEVFLLGTFESIDIGHGMHLGNTPLISPSITLRGDLLQQVMDKASALARYVGVTGYFEVRFWYYPSTGELVVHRFIPTLTRFLSLIHI